MIKSFKTFIFSTVFLSLSTSQELCPPALVDALFYDEKIELSWDQTTSWGDLCMSNAFLHVPLLPRP